MNRSEFANPSGDYRGVALWMLNDELEPAELRRQIGEIEKAGWGALITRTFPGLRTEYLSEEWHDYVRLTIDECKRAGLRVWLQAGYMPAGVPSLAQEDQHMVLLRRSKGSQPVDGEILLHEGPAGAYTAERRPHVLDLLKPSACKRYVAESYTETLATSYGEHFGKTVETVWVDEPHFQPPALPWSDRLPGRFRELWGYDIVPELPAIFGDSGDSFTVRHHYWRTVLTMLLEAYFTEVQSWCEAHGLKFSGHLMGEDTLQAQISWTAGCMPCYEMMGVPGIDHLTRSRHWPAHLPFIMTPKQCSSASNQLGKRDVLAEVYGVSSQGLTFQDRKRIAEWMMMLGVNYRCYHGAFYSMRGRRKRVYAPHLSYQQPWWPHNRHISDYFARLSYLMRNGTYRADVLVVHPLESAYGIYDSTDVQNPYERVAEPTELRKLTELFVAVSDNLLTAHRDFEYGDETLMARHGSVAADGTAAGDQTAVGSGLGDAPAGATGATAARDGTTPRLRIGEMSYRVVLLPSLTTIRESTLELLNDFLDAGGVVLSVGGLPTRVDGVVDERASELAGRLEKVGLSPAELASALDRAAPATARLSGAGAEQLWMHRRSVSGGQLIVIHSPRAESTIEATLTIDGAGSVEVWDPATGNAAPLRSTAAGATTTVEFSVAPQGTIALMHRAGEAGSARPGADVAAAEGVGAATSAATQKPASVRRIELPDRFSIERNDPNAIYLDFCRFSRGDTSPSERLPVVAVQEILVDEDYHGPVTLQFDFEVDSVPRNAHVVVEDDEESDVQVNGKRCAFSKDGWYRDRSFRTAEVTAYLKSGTNTIRLSRDFQPPTLPKFRLGGLFHKSTGVEIESPILIGDFGVSGRVSTGPKQPRSVRYAPEFAVVSEQTDTDGRLVASGYPFFAGEITLSTAVNVSSLQEGERAFLTVRSLDAAVAEVRVDGTEVGALAWHPLEVEVTDAVRKAKNRSDVRVDLTLVGTLRNLLGPHHRPSGEPSQVWRDGWTGYSAAGRRDTKLVAGKDWYKSRNDEGVFWTDDYFFVPFGVQGAAVELRRY